MAAGAHRTLSKAADALSKAVFIEAQSEFRAAQGR